MLVEVKVGLKRDGLKKDGGSGRGWDWSWRKILDASEEYSAATEGFASLGGSELIHVSSLGHDDCAAVSIGAAGDLRDAVVAPVIVQAGSIGTSERSIASSHSIRDSARQKTTEASS